MNKGLSGPSMGIAHQHQADRVLKKQSKKSELLVHFNNGFISLLMVEKIPENIKINPKTPAQVFFRPFHTALRGIFSVF
jgi:hypothetical protein